MPVGKVTVPLAASLNIDRFNLEDITQASSFIENGVVARYGPEPDAPMYVMQRPALNMYADVLPSAATGRSGRGIFYWERTGSTYFVNDSQIFKQNYGNQIGTIGSGNTKVTFLEIGNDLIISDPDNNQLWKLTTTDAVTLVVPGAVLPDTTLSTPPTDIVGGGVVLNGVMYSLASDGSIQGSEPDDGTLWNALNFTAAARSEDKGVYLARHHDNVVALGTRTIEFFYDAGNPVGSALSRREDLSYNIGAVNSDAVWQISDMIVFVGRDGVGGISLYKIEGFKVDKISLEPMSAYLTQNIAQTDNRIVIAGCSAQGHLYCIITIFNEVNQEEATTLVYDLISGYWGIWTTTLPEFYAEQEILYVEDGYIPDGYTLSGFTIAGQVPIIDWTPDTSDTGRLGQGILVNGSVVTISDKLVPVDGDNAGIYVIDGYVEDGYVVASSGFSRNIRMKIRLGAQEFQNAENKFCSELHVIGDYTTNPQTLQVSWADGDSNSTQFDRTLNLNRYDKLTRLGKFNRRSFNFQYEGDEQVRLESVQLSVEQGDA